MPDIGTGGWDPEKSSQDLLTCIVHYVTGHILQHELNKVYIPCYKGFVDILSVS